MTAPVRPWASRITAPDGTFLSDEDCRAAALRLAGRAVEHRAPAAGIIQALEACGLIPYASGWDKNRYIYGKAS